MESIWAAWVWSWGIILWLERVTTLESNQLHLEVSWCVSTANGFLSRSKRHFCTSKLANRRVNSALSTQSFSANCAHGNTAVEICLFIVWQQGKQSRCPCSSLVLKALTAAYISVMIRSEMARDVTHKGQFTETFGAGAQLHLSLCFTETEIFPHVARSICSVLFHGLTVSPLCDAEYLRIPNHIWTGGDSNFGLLTCSTFRSFPYSDSWCSDKQLAHLHSSPPASSPVPCPPVHSFDHTSLAHHLSLIPWVCSLSSYSFSQNTQLSAATIKLAFTAASLCEMAFIKA